MTAFPTRLIQMSHARHICTGSREKGCHVAARNIWTISTKLVRCSICRHRPSLGVITLTPRNASHVTYIYTFLYVHICLRRCCLALWTLSMSKYCIFDSRGHFTLVDVPKILSAAVIVFCWAVKQLVVYDSLAFVCYNDT